ncbi:MAG: hypothetical protein SGILL_001254 [Bacillariaceae sp.]
MPTGGGSTKATAVAAKPGKVSDLPKAEAKPSMMEKVVEEADPPHPEEGEEDDGDEWDCKGPVPPGQEMQCQEEGCENPALRIWVGSVSKDEWLMCPDCEKDAYGSDVEEELNASMAVSSASFNNSESGSSTTPTSVKSGESKDSIATKDNDKEPEVEVPATPSDKAQADNQQFFTPQVATATKEPQGVALAEADAMAEAASHNDDEDDDGEAFELIDFISFQNLKTVNRICNICADAIKEDPQTKYSFACTIWQGCDPKSKKWYYCLDCQEDHFDGFPAKDELVKHNALKNLDLASIHEHVRLMKQKCSQDSNPAVPDLASYLPPLPPGDGTASVQSQKSNSNFVTPPPKSLPSGKSITASLQVAGAAKGKGKGKGGASMVTPGATAAVKKWTQQAEKLGGKGAKIIVDSKEAKEKIFFTLHDSFKPMNTNDLFHILKGIVPSPLLSGALKEMADQNSGNQFADDSDDEDDTKKSKGKDKKSSDDPYGPGSLCFKPGRNANTSVYFVNYGRIPEMDPYARQELLGKLATCKVEMEALEHKIKSVNTWTAKLLSEPTNDEIIGLMKKAEEAVAATKAEVEELKEHQVDPGTLVALKKRKQTMTSHWSKRQRICVSFLSNLEEGSEGAVSMRKSLAGDGSLPLDSDEAVAKAELELAALKYKRGKTTQNQFPLLAAVKLEKGKAKRVYYDPENDG